MEEHVTGRVAIVHNLHVLYKRQKEGEIQLKDDGGVHFTWSENDYDDHKMPGPIVSTSLGVVFSVYDMLKLLTPEERAALEDGGALTIAKGDARIPQLMSMVRARLSMAWTST